MRIHVLLAAAAVLACGGGHGRPCAENRDCPSPQTCVAARCVDSGLCVGSAACVDDGACGSGQHCANGCCTLGVSGSCARDADCSAHADTPVCDTGAAACVACLLARDCGPGKLCQQQKCVALPGCASSLDCSGSTPVCDVPQHACVECLDSSDCHNLNAPNCDSSHHCTASQECRSDTGCAKPTPRCLLPAGRCVTCLGTGDCVDPLVCDAVQNVCLAPTATTCTNESDCASNPAAPHCQPGVNGKPGACVACAQDAHCPVGQVCTGNACAQKTCAADGDCAAPVPRCDTAASPKVCVACLVSGDCPNGGTCQADRTCKAPSSGCAVDKDCATSVNTPYCRTDTKACVACLRAAPPAPAKGCGSGETCTAQNTCASNTCTGDGDCSSLPATPHCNTASGACVACTTAAQCGAGFRCTGNACVPVCTVATQASDCAAPTAVCKESAAGNACVQCLKPADCSGGQTCTANNVCVAPTGCTGNGDCPAATPVCNLGVTPHSCVQCAADPDCKNGFGCDPAAHTCTASGAAGQVCKTGGVCNTGLLCINEGGANGPVCRPRCDPYASTCAAGTVCSWLGFDAAGSFEGYCSAPNGHAAAGAACDPTRFDSCEWNLLCAPRSATTGTCAGICDPAKTGNCGASVCNGIAGATTAAGVVQKFGYCGAASKWGQACFSDTRSSGPDCGDALSKAGAGGLFCAPSYLPAESPQGSILTLCSYTPAATTAIGGAGDSCAQLTDNDCRTGVCLTDGPVTCFSGCTNSSDCSRDGAASGVFCFALDFSTPYRTNTVTACEPTCRNDTDCAALGGGLGRSCDPAPTSVGSSWQAACGPVSGTGKAGGKCSGGSDCASGLCLTGASLQGIELAQSVSGFTAKDGFCLGSASSAADCGVAGTAFKIDVALPLSPIAGDQGVMGRPHPGVCWPQTCSKDSQCTGLSLDPATPRVCAPFKTTTSSSTDSLGCTSDAQCTAAPNLCNVVANNPNPGGVYGSNAGIYGPNGKCRQTAWALECAPSLGAQKAGPGAACTFSDDCRTGHCLVTGTAKYCFGGCSADTDCLNGTHCKTATYLGLTTQFCQP